LANIAIATVYMYVAISTHSTKITRTTFFIHFFMIHKHFALIFELDINRLTRFSKDTIWQYFVSTRRQPSVFMYRIIWLGQITNFFFSLKITN
jgi:hypothetical protein